MNVLYCVPIGDRGGVERFLQDVIVRHDPGHFRPTVLAFSNGKWLTELEALGVRVYCLEGMRLRNPWRVFQAVNAIVKKEHIDLVHSSYPWCHALSAPAAAWNRCKQVWFHHGPMSTKKWQGTTSVLPADLVLTNSNFLCQRLRHTLYVAKKTAVVHYGIDAACFAPDPSRRSRFRRQWNVPESAVAVGLVGFIDRWKGQDVLLQAAQLLRGKLPDLRIFIVGGPRGGLVAEECQQYQAELKSFVADHHLEKMVIFTGHTDVREGALDGLDIFVHASTEPEPFGMVLLEAMANGKAIIASAEGGPLEILTDRVDGLLVEPRRSELLAQAIQIAASDPALRQTLGEQAQSTVMERFSSDSAARQLERHYEDVIQ
jgi:glycosyltransferase involved in cell wall biosynthesis